MVKNLYLLKRSRQNVYFVVGIDHCESCKQALEYQAFHVGTPDRKKKSWYLCMHCTQEPPSDVRISKFREIQMVLLSAEIPPGAIPILSSSELQYSQRLNLFTAASPDADKNIEANTDSVQVIDRTVYAGREEWVPEHLSYVGKPESLLEQEDSWKQDIDLLLEFHKEKE